MIKNIHGKEVSDFINKNRDKYVLWLIGGICFLNFLLGLFLGLFFFIDKNTIILLSIISFLPIYYITEKVGDKLYSWRSGSYGEREVFVAMKYGLNESYFLFSDLHPKQNRTNVDFLVVGPTGIFAIEVKNDAGNINFDGDKLTKNGKKFRKRCPLTQAKDEARMIHDYILEKTGLDKYVTPIVVFSSDYATLPLNSNYYKDCYVTLIKNIFNIIEKNNNLLKEDEIERIERALKEI